MKHIEMNSRTESMKSGFVHSRIDTGIKEEASFILESIGLSVSDAIRLFLNQVVLRKGIPFPVQIPNAETIAAMEAVGREEDMEEVTMEQLRTQFQNERTKMKSIKKKNIKKKK